MSKGRTAIDVDPIACIEHPSSTCHWVRVHTAVLLVIWLHELASNQRAPA